MVWIVKVGTVIERELLGEHIRVNKLQAPILCIALDGAMIIVAFLIHRCGCREENQTDAVFLTQRYHAFKIFQITRVDFNMFGAFRKRRGGYCRCIRQIDVTAVLILQCAPLEAEIIPREFAPATAVAEKRQIIGELVLLFAHKAVNQPELWA